MLRTSVKITLLTLLAIGGLWNGFRAVDAMASAPVETTPVTRLVETAMADDGVDMASYLALAKFRLLRASVSEQDAAFKFVSFALIATRATVEACRAQGIDVTPAVRRFAAEHENLYVRAAGSLASDGLNAERIWTLLKPTLERIADNHVRTLGNGLSTDVAGACRWMQSNPAGYSTARNYADSYPRLHRLLVE
jgi:hypothetical protein